MGYYLLDNPNPHGEHFYRTRLSTLRVIVLHITAGLEDIDLIGPDASAEQTARYCATTDRYVSWHGGSDSDSHLYLLPPAYTAWHASDYNSSTYGWEISKRDTSWSDEPKAWVEATLKHAADGLRPVAKGYNIPHRLLTRAQVDAGMSGFTYHMWLDPTRRSDPGADFPITRFFELLKGDDMANFTDRHAKILDMLDEAFGADPDNPNNRGYLRRLIQEIVADTNDLQSRVASPPTLDDIAAKVDAVAAAVAKLPADVWTKDNVVKNPYDNPKNPGWQAGNAVEHVLLQVLQLKDEVKKISGGQS